MTATPERLPTSGSETGEQSRPARNSGLRAAVKVVPQDQRAHNRSLVLQHLFHKGPSSRADLARATELTKVTVSDLIATLIAEGLVEELGQQRRGVGKPATLVGMCTEAFQIIAVDLGRPNETHGVVTTLRGEVVARRSIETKGQTGETFVATIESFIRQLEQDATAPLLGVGIGSPGIITDQGVVLEASNRELFNVPLAAMLSQRLGLPVHVANDADIAALGEFAFGQATDWMLVLTIRHGIGAGLVVDGSRVHGARSAVGELGHLTVKHGPTAQPCACGRRGCLETVLSEPAIRQALLNTDDAQQALTDVGRVLGRALAPVVATLNLSEVILSGPIDLLAGPLMESAEQTIVDTVMSVTAEGFRLRLATLDEDIVLAGAAGFVLSAELGVS